LGAPEAPTEATEMNEEEWSSEIDGNLSEAEQSNGEDRSTNQVDQDAPTMQVNFKNHRDQGIISVKKDLPMNKDMDKMYRIHVRAGHLYSLK
jgi:hypothetical protein